MVTDLEEADRRVDRCSSLGCLQGSLQPHSREKLRPSEPIEQYLRLVLRTISALLVLNMTQGMAVNVNDSYI